MMRGATLKINGDRGSKKVRLRVDYADPDDPYLPKMSKTESVKRRGGDESRVKDSAEPKRRRAISRSKSGSPPPPKRESSKVLLDLLIVLRYHHDTPISNYFMVITVNIHQKICPPLISICCTGIRRGSLRISLAQIIYGFGWCDPYVWKFRKFLRSVVLMRHKEKSDQLI